MNHFDLIQSEFDKVAAKKPARKRTVKQQKQQSGEAKRFMDEMGDKEVSNPSPKAKKKTIKIKSLPHGDDAQKSLFQRLYKSWKGSGGISSVTKDIKQKEKLKTEKEKHKSEIQKLKDKIKAKNEAAKSEKLKRQEAERARFELERKREEITEKPAVGEGQEKRPEKWWRQRHRETDEEQTQSQKVPEKVKQQITEENTAEKNYSKQVNVENKKADTSSEKYQNTLKTVRKNEKQLPIDVSGLKDPLPPSAIKKDMVDRHTEGINNTLSAIKVDATILDYSDSPNVLTYDVKINADPSDEKYIVYRNKLSSSKIAETIGSIIGEEGVTVAEHKQQGGSLFRISVPKGKKINEGRDPVMAKELLTSDDFVNRAKSLTKMPVVIGIDTDNKPVINDFTEVPHLLLCGTSGSGKSVSANTSICSIIAGKKPSEAKIVLIDAIKKGAEFGAYDDVAHLALPVVKDESQVVDALQKVRKEAEERYSRFSNIKVGGVPLKSVEKFNSLITKDQAKMTDDEKEAYNNIPETDRKIIPYLNVYIDEVADLLKHKQYGKQVRHEIDSTLKVARAAGIHLTLISQSPDKDTIDGTLQQNLQGKLILRLVDQADASGADVPEATDLLDNGDGVYADATGKKRIQSAYMSDSEIANITNQAKGKQEFIQAKETEAAALKDKKVDPELQKIRDNVKKSIEKFEEIERDSAELKKKYEPIRKQIQNKLDTIAESQANVEAERAKRKGIEEYEAGREQELKEKFQHKKPSYLETLDEGEEEETTAPNEPKTEESKSEDTDTALQKEIDALTAPVSRKEVETKSKSKEDLEADKKIQDAERASEGRVTEDYTKNMEKKRKSIIDRLMSLAKRKKAE